MFIKKRLYYQIIAFVLCFSFFISLSINAFASDNKMANPSEQMSDISGHWAESQMKTWVEKGLIFGYPDRTLRPNNPITRAEFIALTNRAFGFTKKADISFSDVHKDNWFYDDIAKAVAAGYIVGYNGIAAPGSNITRQEAAAVICRILDLQEYNSTNAIEKFSDYNSISAWSRESVNSIVNEGYMIGNSNGTFGPLRPITRAETVIVLSKAAGDIYNVEGTYNEIGTIAGNVTVNTPNVILTDGVVEGNLYLTPGIGNGTVIMRNITVKGTTTIAGGGENSIVFENCNLNKVVVSREDGKVRVSAQGSTNIQIVVVDEEAFLDATLLNEDGTILIVYVMTGEEVDISGNFDTVHIENEGAVINAKGATIENMVIDGTASNATIRLSGDSSVTNMEINAPVTVTGQGTIENAVIGEEAEETTFEKKPITTESPGTDTPQAPSGGSAGGGGGSSGGGAGGSTLTKVNISAISGIIVPVTGQTPVSTITQTAQYTGTVTWSPAHNSFEASTIYTATITLTAKTGYTLTGVNGNFFTVAGATSVSNSANSGVVTAVFPATAASGGDEVPPALTADITGNFPKTNLDITFTDDVAWRNEVMAVKVNGNILTQATQYELSEGKLRLKTIAIPAMQTADDYNITIEATGYQAAAISQTVAAGLSGSGTSGDPFVVATANDLDKVRYYIGVPTLYFKQTADINLNSIDWQPIGLYDQTLVTDGDPFMANYNGNDYYIENLIIADNSQTYKSGSGLFSHTKEAGLSNIRLKGVDIDVYNTGSVGALVGEAIETSITDCLVENSTKVKGNNSVGGLIGYAHQSTISGSSADILVTGESSSTTITHRVGGFIGHSGNNTITGCSAHGNVTGIKEVGGFVGYMNYGNITGCFADGNVTSYENTAEDTGGFVGLNYFATADQCYAISTVSGRKYVGGFAGRNIGTITNCYARGSVAYTGTVAGGFVGKIQNNAANLLGGGSPSDTGYNYSDVAISGSGAKIGAFYGEYDTSAPGGSGTIHHNHYNSGIAVESQGSGANGLTLENMKKQTSFPEWDFANVWAIQEDVKTPYHRWETLSDNANLNSLSVVSHTLVPDFLVTTTSYSVDTDSNVYEVDIIAAPADNGASVMVNGTPLGLGNTASIDLGAAGTDTIITVRVTAENGVTTKDYTITVSRAAEPQTNFTLTYTAGPNGSITGDTPQTVAQGDDGTAVTAIADSGYQFVNWSDGSTDNPRTDTNVTGNISVTANFALIGEDSPVFSDGYPSIGSITDQGFRVYASADVEGIAYYIVVANGAAAPTSQQVKNRNDYPEVTVLRNGSFYISSSGQVSSSPVVALSANTNYDVYVVAETTGGTLQAAPVKLDATTLELQAPQFFTFVFGDGDYPRTENIGGRQLDIKAGFNNKPGKVYYMLVPEDSQAPDALQVIDGMDYGSVTVDAHGVFAIGSTGQVFTETVTGLEPQTSYDIYLAAGDNSTPMNINTAVKKLTVTTLESDEPAFNEGSPFIGFSIKEDGFAVGAGINKPGWLYTIVVAGGSAAPTSEQVKAGLGYGDVTVLAKGSVEALDPILVYDIAEVKNLEPSTPYDVYVVAEDASKIHIQSVPTKLQVTTTAFNTGAPSMSVNYPVIGNTTDTGATIAVKTSGKSKLYYMVLPGGSSISNSDVVAGQYTRYGYPAWHRQAAAGMIETLRDEEYQITIEGLDPGTEYRFYACPANWYNDGYVEGVNQGTAFTTKGSAPPTADLDITAQDDDKFNISASFATQNATAYYMVVPDGSPRPTYAQVWAGEAYEGVLPNAAGNFAMSAGGGNALITGLAAASNYNVYVVFEASGNPNLHTTTPNRLDASTLGSQPPGMNVNVRQLGDTSFSLEASISKTGTIYYILVARDAEAPTAAQVQAGAGYSSVSIIESNSIAANENTVYTERITGLSPNTAYDLYVAAEAPLTGTPAKRQVQTLEPYAPEFNANSPYRIVRSDGFDIYGSLSRDGSVHYLVVPRDQTAPTAAQVQNPAGYAETKSAHGSLTGINADTSFDIDIAGLTPDTQYDLYFVAEGTSGGLSTLVKSQYETLTALGFIEEPTVTEIRYYRFTVEGMLNRKCDLHYIVVPAGSAEPTPQQVKAGVDYDSVEVVSAETVNNVLYYSRPVSGLEDNRTYDMYMVFEEAVGLSGFEKIEGVTTAVVPEVAYSTFAAQATPRAYVSGSYIGVKINVALNRPGTAYIARFADGTVPTQQDVINKALSGNEGIQIDIVHPEVVYTTIRNWSLVTGKLYIVACDNEEQINYITPSPQEITILTE